MATRYLRTREAAKLAGISYTELLKHARAGNIGYIRFGRGWLRFTDEHIDEFIRANTRPAQRKAATS